MRTGANNCIYFDNVRVLAIDPQLEVAGAKGMDGGFVGFQQGLEMARVGGGAICLRRSGYHWFSLSTKPMSGSSSDSPFGNFQAIRFKVPTAASEIESAR